MEWYIAKADMCAQSFESEMALQNYGYFLTQFFTLKPRAGRLLVYALKEEISNSKVWSTSQKNGMLSNLKKVLVKDWHWSETDYSGALPARESLMNRCVRFLTGI